MTETDRGEWRLDTGTWPGPNRRKWRWLNDSVCESPDGRHAAVVYSCGEIGVGKEIGHFALLAGPPDRPRLLVRSRCLTCLAPCGGPAAHWIGNRYCVVTPYRLRPDWSGGQRSVSGTLYLDVDERRAAYLAGVHADVTLTGMPAGLVWRRWRWLSVWPMTWRGA